MSPPPTADGATTSLRPATAIQAPASSGEPLPWTRRDGLAVLLLVLAPFLLLAPLFLPGAARRWFPSGDFIDQFYAFAHYETTRFAAGELPLWNPYAYGGSPFWADVQAAVAYPPSLALGLFSAWRWGDLPLLALELEAVAHLALAGGLTYAFARRALDSRLGGLVAATSFGLGGYLLGYPMLQLAVLEADAWLPLALLGAWRLAARSDPVSATPGATRQLWRAARPDPVLALALGMAILAGHPQSALYLLYTTLAYAVWRAWRAAPSPAAEPVPPGPAPASPSRLRLAARGVGLPSPAFLLGLSSSLALAAGLSAAGWWPALELMARSNRAEADYAMLSNGFPPQELLGLVLHGLTLWSPLYVGILPLALALAALLAWARRSGTTAIAPSSTLADLPFWSLAVLLALLLSLGRHGFLFDLFYLGAPGFDLFRGQERAALLVAFGLAMMAGAGASLWWRGDRALGRDLARTAAALSLAGAFLALVAQPGLRPSALHLILVCGGVALLPLSAAYAGVGGSTRLGPPPRWAAPLWAGLLVLLIALDLGFAVGRVNLVAEPPAELGPSPQLALLAQDLPQRVDNEDRLPPNFGLLHAIEATSGASPLRLRRFDALRQALQADHPVRWRDLLAVSHVLSWRADLGVESQVLMATGPEDQAMRLHQLAWSSPFAWRAARAEQAPDDAWAIARLRDDDFAALSTVILHPDGSADPRTPDDPIDASASSLSVRARRPGYARAITAGASPAWVVFSELDYPGWRGFVDGRPAPVLRADLALMALAVPAGEHVVEIRFTAPRVWQGLAASLLSALLLATLLARRPKSGTSNEAGASDPA